ncbi:MAG: hypothetical protein IAF38_16050 [Bacteroidia bacterium]|nr:hypothetical protein [Bacteroidia bacterium]
MEEKKTDHENRSRISFLRVALVVSVIINLLLLSAFVIRKICGAPSLSAKQKMYADSLRSDSANYAVLRSEVWPQSRANFFSELPIDTGDIVFVGSSLTEDFPVSEMFGDLRIKNRGIDGNTSYEILNRTWSLIAGHPKKIFIETGINDLNNGCSADTILFNLSKTVSLIKTISPQSSIYIQSLFPTGKIFSSKNPEIKKCNEQIKKFCTENKIAFLDLYPAFCKNDQMNDSLTWDGLHLNGKGYFLWKTELERFVKE